MQITYKHWLSVTVTTGKDQGFGIIKKVSPTPSCPSLPSVEVGPCLKSLTGCQWEIKWDSMHWISIGDKKNYCSTKAGLLGSNKKTNAWKGEKKKRGKVIHKWIPPTECFRIEVSKVSFHCQIQKSHPIDRFPVPRPPTEQQRIRSCLLQSPPECEPEPCLGFHSFLCLLFPLFPLTIFLSWDFRLWHKWGKAPTLACPTPLLRHPLSTKYTSFLLDGPHIDWYHL